MQRSFEATARVLALTAAFLASSGRIALGATKLPEPNLVQLARDIDRLKTKPGKAPNTAYLTKNLAHGQQEIIALSSTAIKHGKPAPNVVDMLSVTINPTRNSARQHLAPVRSDLFQKQTDREWNADETINSATDPHAFLHIDVLGETTIQNYVETFTPAGIVISMFTSQEDPQQAQGLFHDFETDMYQDLGDIIGGAGPGT